MPPKPISDIVIGKKDFLFDNIGPFGSLNSLPHFTVLGFSEERNLEFIRERTRHFCANNAIADEIRIDSYKTFSNHTFYLAPSQQSRKYIRNLVFGLYKCLSLTLDNYTPHMTITKDLDEEKMRVTKQIFSNDKIDLAFSCNSFLLRAFDKKVQHYSQTIEEFRFDQSQGRLF
ncbi:2'-5' RNA ligase family protein [Flavobacterium sp.]|uniref:2'-5' RNA ligase family protein n=1 Tax=Flavobacterium sp. TaxID=239 RepID=UPI0025C413DF|nr:2'-5' RNA ligase family protein [Flavobacterium sp.]